MLRIGRIAYANCSPIFHELQKQASGEDYQFIGGVPSHLNALLAAGEIDVCPSSSIQYALHPERYLILPDLSISSVGAVGSVGSARARRPRSLHDVPDPAEATDPLAVGVARSAVGRSL